MRSVGCVAFSFEVEGATPLKSQWPVTPSHLSAISSVSQLLNLPVTCLPSLNSSHARRLDTKSCFFTHDERKISLGEIKLFWHFFFKFGHYVSRFVWDSFSSYYFGHHKNHHSTLKSTQRASNLCLVFCKISAFSCSFFLSLTDFWATFDGSATAVAMPRPWRKQVVWYPHCLIFLKSAFL